MCKHTPVTSGEPVTLPVSGGVTAAAAAAAAAAATPITKDLT